MIIIYNYVIELKMKYTYFKHKVTRTIVAILIVQLTHNHSNWRHCMREAHMKTITMVCISTAYQYYMSNTFWTFEIKILTSAWIC